VCVMLYQVADLYALPVDAETKAEFEEMQKSSSLTGSSNAAAQLQNFDFASWLAGGSSSGGNDAAGQTAQASASEGGSAGGGKSKGRR